MFSHRANDVYVEQMAYRENDDRANDVIEQMAIEQMEIEQMSKRHKSLSTFLILFNWLVNTE